MSKQELLPRPRLREAIEKALKRSPVAVLIGPRQCGKSTLAHQLAGKSRTAARAVPYYFAQYEEAYQLHVQRPVRVTAVHDEGQAPVPSTGAGARTSGRLLVHSHSVERPDERVVWRARGLVNATGTWGKPFWPAYPGRGTFGGRQLHARDFRSRKTSGTTAATCFAQPVRASRSTAKN